MIRRPPRSTLSSSSAASDVYKRQDFIGRLGQVDGRIESLDNRQQESVRQCTGEALQSWTPTASFPDGSTFPMKFSCSEVMNDQPDSTLSVYFGIDGNTTYLAELQVSTGSNPTMAVLVKAHNASGVTTVEVWQVVAISSNYSSWMHIYAQDGDTTTANKALELSVAGQGPNLGVGCGVRLFAGANYTKATGDFSDPAPPNPGCGAVTNPVCVSSSDLANSTQAPCDALVYSIPAFTTTTLDSGNFQTVAGTMASGSGMPTLTDFNS
eukprot:TRINITY_DN18261_c0_g1_i5.p1 TRINITY_DN18261_c0_g1~~TRINITY_DN18261_c0_g1_i5.p1  ORF type:complete len:267 (+),score=58.12 TRINITY_DN18261_c0_g1_i5:81-881(+)